MTRVAELDAAIVIPALNEAANIGRLLDDCAAQESRPREVIVVDAGSTDGTAELLAARKPDFPTLRVVRAEGFRRSAVAAVLPRHLVGCSGNDGSNASHEADRPAE